MEAVGRHAYGRAALVFQSLTGRLNNAPKVQELEPPPLFEVPLAHHTPEPLAGLLSTTAAFSSAGTASKIALAAVIPKIAARKEDFMWVNRPKPA